MLTFHTKKYPDADDLKPMIDILRKELQEQACECLGYAGDSIDDIIIFDGSIDIKKIAQKILESSSFIN